jgi:Asp-tRNA(Asn)/Glu-tRNA(Gln) amidotransferase A subunit family amidase
LGPLSRRQFLLTSLATSVLLLGNRAFGAAEDLTRLSLQELQSGSRVTTPAYIQACRELDRIRRTIGNIFSSVDLLVTPTTPILPITIEEAKNKPEDWRSIRNTSPFSI